MEKLLEILEKIRPDVDFSKAENLIDNAILDSFDIVTLVGELNEEFDIQIGVEDLLPENFNSIEAIFALIARLRD
jgi:acyl carrier protein